MSAKRRLVLAGNGMVGHRLVAALHERDPNGTWQITVLGEENRHAYDRVALSSVFDGRSPEDLCLVANGFYDSGRSEVFLPLRPQQRQRSLKTRSAFA